MSPSRGRVLLCLEQRVTPSPVSGVLRESEGRVRELHAPKGFFPLLSLVYCSLSLLLFVLYVPFVKGGVIV